jgi:hypothetical protein
LSFPNFVHISLVLRVSYHSHPSIPRELFTRTVTIIYYEDPQYVICTVLQHPHSSAQRFLSVSRSHLPSVCYSFEMEYTKFHHERCFSYFLLNAETRVRSQVISSEIRGGRSDTVAGFSPSSSVSPANHHSTIAPYSSITAPRGVRQPWPSSTLSYPRYEVRDFISDRHLASLEVKVFITIIIIIIISSWVLRRRDSDCTCLLGETSEQLHLLEQQSGPSSYPLSTKHFPGDVPPTARLVAMFWPPQRSLIPGGLVSVKP